MNRVPSGSRLHVDQLSKKSDGLLFGLEAKGLLWQNQLSKCPLVLRHEWTEDYRQWSIDFNYYFIILRSPTMYAVTSTYFELLENGRPFHCLSYLNEAVKKLLSQFGGIVSKKLLEYIHNLWRNAYTIQEIQEMNSFQYLQYLSLRIRKFVVLIWWKSWHLKFAYSLNASCRKRMVFCYF